MSIGYVAQKVEEPFFDLLKIKSYKDITVGEIVKNANCSRSSFYRNYTKNFRFHEVFF